MSPNASKLPVRTCVGCRTARPKRELVRLVGLPSGEVVVDPSGKLNGRGAYLCPDEACWIMAERRRGLERALSVRLDSTTWQNLLASRAKIPSMEVSHPQS